MNARKAIAGAVGGIGLVLALLMMLGMSVMGSLMADARTDRITGPGVDIFLRTRFPAPGSVMDSGFLGYWLFARPLMAGLELESIVWTVLLCAAWLLGPPLWMWRRSKRRRHGAPTIPAARVV